MKKKIVVVGMIIALIMVVCSGCTEETSKSTENGNQITIENEIPVAIIKINNESPLWWNDTLSLSASDSYDSDGGISAYIWWFEEGNSKYGESVSYHLIAPNPYYYHHYYEIDLAVIDDKGAVGVASEELLIYRQPVIYLRQKEGTHLLEITDLSKDNLLHLRKNEVRIQYANLDGKYWQYGLPGPLLSDAEVNDNDIGDYYHDVDGDGNVSEGDTFDLDKILAYAGDVTSGSIVKIILTGGEGHNSKNVLNSASSQEFEIE